jgi:hypothetical protein
MSKYSLRRGDVAGLLECFAHPGEGAGALAAASTGGLNSRMMIKSFRFCPYRIE